VFETVTSWDGCFVVNVATNTLYEAENPLVPYLVMSDEEMKIASRITIDDEPDVNSVLVLSFRVPQFLYGVHENPGRVLVISNADDGCGGMGMGGMVTTRDAWATTFWYDKDIYNQKVQDAQALLHSMFDYPSLFMKAQVSKALVSMIALGKYHTMSFPLDMYPDNDCILLVLSTKFPMTHMGQILHDMGFV
jgi:hypothetical protein